MSRLPVADRPSTTGELLLACLRQTGDGAVGAARLPPLDGIDLRHLPLEADHHGVGPLLHRLFADAPEIPEAARAELRQLYDRQWQVHLRTLSTIDAIAPTLDDLGVRWVTFKGPMLVEHAYRGAEVRSYVDLDVLVDRRRVGEVLDALLSSGSRMRDRNWRMISADMRGEVTVIMPNGSSVDLHWHLFNEPQVRAGFSLSVDDLLDRARRLPLNGAPVPTLDPEDTLLVLCIHTTLSGGHRLVWYKDLERVAATDDIDWDVLVDRARAWGIGLVAAVALDRAVGLLGMDVPVGVLDRLAPAWGWRAVPRAIDRLRPLERSFDRRMSGRMVIASTRRHAATSALALGRTASEVVVEVVRNPGHPWRRRTAPESVAPAPNPLWLDDGTPADRQRWLERIAATS